MVKFEEHVVQMIIYSSACNFNLIELSRNVAQVIQVLWSDLRDMQVYQMTVVSIELSQLIFGKILGV